MEKWSKCSAFIINGGNMDIGIIVFAYNRSGHLRKVLDGLSKNKGVSKLYIFQDGLKSEEHQSEWENTQQVIKATNWCKVVYQLSPYNKGLADSIVDGINTVLEENDAVVVLEDDCVPHPLFIEYATKCLEKYDDNKRVFSINGYAWNLNVDSNGTDAYFAGRFGSWGWATWKDRWELYEQDYKILVKIQRDPQKKQQLDIWASDAVSCLIGNVYGTCNSWAVFWGLKCIEQGMLCLTPYYSLIDNIGFDGSGVHCGQADINTPIREWDNMNEIILPESVNIPNNCETVFANEFRWVLPETKLKCYNQLLYQWIELFQKGINIIDYFMEQNIECIAVWGRGDLCKLLLNQIRDKIKIKYIIDSRGDHGFYENIPVVSALDINDEVQEIVVIPVYDMQRIQESVDDCRKSRLTGIDKILKYLSDK